DDRRRAGKRNRRLPDEVLPRAKLNGESGARRDARAIRSAEAGPVFSRADPAPDQSHRANRKEPLAFHAASVAGSFGPGLGEMEPIGVSEPRGSASGSAR